MTMTERVADFCEWDSDFWAVPASYRQIREAGIELDSEFDEDAGEGAGHGEIVLTCRIDDDGDRYYGAAVLQCTLARLEPHWMDCMRSYYSASGSSDRLNRARNERAVKGLFDSLAGPENVTRIAVRFGEIQADVAAEAVARFDAEIEADIAALSDEE